MKIIKVDNENNESKYEVYNMFLDDKKIKIYREEQARRIKFYRLSITSQQELTDFVKLINSFQKGKTIFETVELPVGVARVICGDEFNPYPFSSSTIELSPYSDEKPNPLTESIIKGYDQQEKFLERFIDYGLKDYIFEPSQRWDISSYIFLNPYVECGTFGTYGYLDNVVSLPYEIMALHLLECLEEGKPFDESIWYYTDYV